MVSAVLSGNRNFDGRINPDIRLNYLASPPLVVAYALAGSMNFDFDNDPLGVDSEGNKILLSDIWPSPEEISELISKHIDAAMYTKRYGRVFEGNQLWQELPVPTGVTYEWENDSTYLRKPTFLDNMPKLAPGLPDIVEARVLAKLGDQITTDHLSPAGAIPASSVAGQYLEALGTSRSDLNTYASRRGNLEVMMRGTLANVRLINQLVPGEEGNKTLDFLDGNSKSIFDAAMNYKSKKVPLIILGGKLYGAGSSRDWAAKGPALLGVKAVIAESFERIHRSNLICMGILPLQFLPGDSANSLGLSGFEKFTILDLARGVFEKQIWVQADQRRFQVEVRLETPRERDYLEHGGVLQYVLRRLSA
jgi:aconitate hydratase